MTGFTTLITRLSGLLLAAMWLISQLTKRDSIGSVVARITWIMPTLFCVALVVPNFWLLMTLLLIFLPIVARNKADAAVLYVVALVSLPTVSVWAKLGSISLLYVDNYKVLTTGLLLAVATKPGPRGRVSGLAAVPVFILFILDAVAQGRGYNITSIMRAIAEAFFHWALPFIAVSLAVSRKEDVKRVVLAIVSSAGALCVVAIYQARTFWPMYESVITHYGIDLTISQGSKIRGGMMRTGTSFAESTSFGWYLVIALLLTLQSRDRFRSQVHLMAMVGLIGIGLLLTQARGAWLGAAIGLVLLDCYHRRFMAAAIKSIAGAVGYGIAIPFASKFGMLSEVLSSKGGAGSTVDYRAQLLTRGLDAIRANPFWGYSPGAIQVQLADLRQGEGIIDFVNAYVYYGMATGVIGVAAFASCFVWAGWVANTQRRYPGEMANIAAPVLLAVSGMTLVTAGTSGFGGSAATFFIILLALASVRARTDAGYSDSATLGIIPESRSIRTPLVVG